jgi:hypothetical protein
VFADNSIAATNWVADYVKSRVIHKNIRAISDSNDEYTADNLRALTTQYWDYYSANLPDKTLITVGIHGSNDHVYYWCGDDTVRSCTTSDPTKYQDFYSVK